jgi:hypothetical protein
LAEFQALMKAVVTYADSPEVQRRIDENDEQYIKHFDTFMDCWQDYVPPKTLERMKRNGTPPIAAVPQSEAGEVKL